MNDLYNFLLNMTPFRGTLRGIVIFLGLLIVMIVIFALISAAKEQIREQRLEREREDNLRNIDYDSMQKEKKAALLREVVAPDGVDTGPLSYLILHDGGKDVYVRTFTIVSMPRRDKFATTFAGLLDFPNCTSSIFVRPISEEQMIHKMDRHITMLSSEQISAGEDINRRRKLRAQLQDANSFAEQVENGENRFFSVGFVFTLYASSVRELNNMTANFRSEALQKNIQITSCFAVQAEAFMKNAPFNDTVSTGSIKISSDAVKYFQMDKRSISAIYNYTQSSYSHKSGVALGRDIFTGSPIVFDVYDGSHDGFTIVIAGKTGCGKSATIKMLACRQVIHGYHFVAVDSQARKGMSEGEYAGLAQLCDGVNFQISNKSREVMNIFEVAETTKTEKDENNEIREVRTLELSDKVSMVSSVLSTMVRDTDSGKDASLELNTYIHRILIDNITQMYKSFGIVDGDPDSLYTSTDSVQASDIHLSSGRAVKKLPTLTDFYKQVLLSDRDNKDDTLRAAYNIIIMSLRDFVKELYYSDLTRTFFTKDQYEKLPLMEGGAGRKYLNDMHQTESVVEIHGYRAYFDGQSTVHITRDCPFTNIDISQLPDSEKKLARQVAIDFVNENFIKKNSENINSADKLEVIFDECHEMFSNQYCLETIDNVVRTARKRNVAIILSSQTIKEYDNHPETQAILKQAAVKFVFKQDMQDHDYLMKTLGLTAAQVDYILNNLGGNPSDESDKNRHRGEVCIIDNKQVAFCKVDYRKNTEALPVETDARGIEALFKMQAS